MDLPKQLDLGSGGTPRTREGYDGWGVDVYETGNKQVRICDLVLDQLPFEDNTFDLVTAYDVLEHITPIVYIPVFDDYGHYMGMQRRSCMIELFNEIYRVLKPNGEFYHQTPAYHPNENSQAVWQDPTHVYVWTPVTSNYFSGDYFGHHDSYGHTSDFTLVNKDWSNGHFCETYRATKPMREVFTL
jgi:SAM-dependent methyltransferase